ncbi:MAG: hypothetical protein GY870_00450, partial [archaeon]|nr:hypothetical protein [archaeon]
QFLENELAGFGDFIPLTMVIKILDSINDTMSNYSEKYLKQGQSLSEKWNKESEQGLTELDQYIEQSKYSHKKELDNKEISEIPVNQINSQPIDHIQENNQIREPKSIAKTDTKPIQKPPLDNDYIEKNWIQSEFYRSQTSFVKELPSKFVIDPAISDLKIRETLYQLNSDISGLIQLAEKEIELFKSEEKTFEYVQNQIKVFLQQIKIKQLEIRAYEYELYRVKLGRVLS